MQDIVTKIILAVESSEPKFPTLELLSQKLEVSAATLKRRLK